MAAAESAPSSLGPRYAPEDPTLPKPWMGLIDGSTGLQYYWNPETNVTQYERPVVALPPPVPAVLPPVVAAPKTETLPSSQNLQQGGSSSLPVQQLSGTSSLGVQQLSGASSFPVQQLSGSSSLPVQQLSGGSSLSLQQLSGSSSMPAQQLVHQGGHSAMQPNQHMQYYQPGQQGQLSQQTGQSMQYHQPGQQSYPLAAQQSYLQPAQQSYTQSSHQFSQQPMQQPSSQLAHHQPSQIMPPQPQLTQQQQTTSQHQVAGQLMQQQQTPYPLGQQMQLQSQPAQKMAQQHGQQGGYPKAEEPLPQYGKQVGYPSVQLQTSAGLSANSNISTGGSQVQTPQMGAHSGTLQQQLSGPPSTSGQQPSGAPLHQIHQSVDAAAIQRQPQLSGVPRSVNQVGHGASINPTPVGLPPGTKEPGEDLHGRTKPDLFSHAAGPREMHEMGLHQQPKLSPLPVPQKLQEMRSGGTGPQSFVPGLGPGYNLPSARSMPNSYVHGASGQPFPNAPQTGPPPGVMGSMDFSRSSAADAYRRQHDVTAMGENVPAPFMTFEATGFPPEILREMHFAGFLSPTPIQAQTWPIALQGRDIVAIAKTGSGKTLGYLIPAFLHLRRLRNNPQVGPTVLVLSPTRELATQIQEEVVKFGRSSGVCSTCLYGGAPKGPQIREIERGADIVIATPGRLNDMLEMNKIDFRQVSFLVLDEADRMLDMGFEPQIRRIVNEIPPRRQTLMYTATWPKEVRKIAGDLLFNPVQVNIGSIDELAANTSITQYVEVVPMMERQRRLEQILRSQERGSKMIIFCSTKRLCDQLTRGIGRSFGAIAIHGDKSQGERDWALNQFRTGSKPILVATDVAARGLDIKDIRVVINYDFPTGIEDYVHRIGRTGRAGATGVSYTFFSDQDWRYAADLIKVLEGANQRVPNEIREMAARGAPPFSKGRGGISRWESGGGRWDSGGGRGMRDGSNNGFGGRGGRGDHFGGRGDHFGGRGDQFGGRGDQFGGRNMGRGRGFGPGGRGRGGPGPHDRYGFVEGRGGRFDNRRPFGNRNRGRSYSRSPERGRGRGYDRSRSPSRSRSRSRSYSRSPSYSRSRSWSRSRSRSRSGSYDRFDRTHGTNSNRPQRVSGFDIPPPAVAENPQPSVANNQVPFISNNPSPSLMGVPQPSGSIVPHVSGSVAPLVREMSPMSPGVTDTGTYLKSESMEQVLVSEQGSSSYPPAIPEPSPGHFPD